MTHALKINPQHLTGLIRRIHRQWTDHAPIYDLTEGLAVQLREQNPDFDPEEFIAACARWETVK